MVISRNITYENRPKRDKKIAVSFNFTTQVCNLYHWCTKTDFGDKNISHRLNVSMSTEIDHRTNKHDIRRCIVSWTSKGLTAFILPHFVNCFCIYDIKWRVKLTNDIIGVGAIFCWGRGREWTTRPSCKSLASCPNCYETVEEKQGSYDKLTLAYMWNKYFLHMNLSNEPKNTLKETAVSAISTAEDINDTIHCWLQSWHMPFLLLISAMLLTRCCSIVLQR